MGEGIKEINPERIDIEETLRLLSQAGIEEAVLKSLEKQRVILSAEGINPEIAEILTAEHQKITGCLVENALSKKVARDCDTVIDTELNRKDVFYATPEAKFEGRIENVLEKVLENLKKYFQIKGIGITYKNPLSQAEEKDKVLATQDVEKEVTAGIVKNYNPKGEFHQNGADEFHHRESMTLGLTPIYIDFIFSDTKNTNLILLVIDAVKSVIDTFFDSQLKKFLKQNIDAKKREIIEKYSSGTEFKWRNICVELLQMLGEMGLDGLLLCKRFDSQNPEITQIDKAGKITEKSEENAQTIQQMANLLVYNFNGFQDITNPNKGEDLGKFLFKYKNSTEQDMARFICNCLSDVLGQREGLRKAFVKSVTLKYANAILDDDVEKQGQHEIVTLFGDINGYSEFSNKIGERVKRGEYKKDPLPEIMERYKTEINKIIARNKKFGVFDKMVGDAVIIHFRPPFNKEGKDIDNKKDGAHDISSHIQNALEMSHIVQGIWDKVLEDYERENNIILPPHPINSWGIKSYEGVVGIYGDIKSEESPLEITVYGPKMNETARLQGAAKKGAVLVEEKTWEKYLKGGQKKFVQLGLSIVLFGKNIPDPIHAVTVITRKEFEEMQKNQRQFFAEREPLRRQYYEKNPETPIPYYYCTEETMSSFPDGDYTVAMINEEPEGPVILEVAMESHRFKIKLQRDRINYMQFSVSKKSLDLLEKERRQHDCSRRTTLRVINNKFNIVRYVDIEEVIKEKINELAAENKKSQQESFTLEQLPRWKYEIIKKEDEEDGDIKFTLSGCGCIFNLLVKEHEKNAIIGEVSDKGYVDHREGCLFF